MNIIFFCKNQNRLICKLVSFQTPTMLSRIQAQYFDLQIQQEDTLTILKS